MFKDKFESHFHFSRSEQSGILLLIGIISILIYLNFFFPMPDRTSIDLNSPELKKLKDEMDSLRSIELEKRKPRIFPFNPNFITDFKAYVLGMTPVQFDALKEYRAAGKWIYSAVDFQRVTGVDKDWIDSMKVYFKFPKWVSTQNKRRFKHYNQEFSYKQKTDLNSATEVDLQRVNGIGPAFAERIIKYRTKLGGFSDDVQLYFVFGLDAKVVDRLLKQFTVKTPKTIKKMNVNSASVSDIATIPGISFSLAKDIWEYVRLREGIGDLNELTKFEEISAHELMLIQLYLSTD